MRKPRVNVIKLTGIIAEKKDFDNTVEVLIKCLEMLYFDARIRGKLSHETTMKVIGEMFTLSATVFSDRYEQVKGCVMSAKQELQKVAKREKYFSTLAKKEGKGAAQRVRSEKGAAKKDSEWEVKVDNMFAKKRAKIANIAKTKANK